MAGLEPARRCLWSRRSPGVQSLEMSVLEQRWAHTHEVTNQPPPLVDYNRFRNRPAAGRGGGARGGPVGRGALRAIGALAGSADIRRRAFEANENPPKLRTHDRYGNRINEVEFHPAWHELLGLAVQHQLHSLPWREPGPGAHVARGAAFLCMTEAEAGIGCPLSATYSVVPALRSNPRSPQSGNRASSPPSMTLATCRLRRSQVPWPGWG